MKWIKSLFNKPTMKHILINQTGNSNKFWAIEQVDNKYIVQWGKIGTKGRINEKEFQSSVECRNEIDKLVKEKVGKGYVATSDLSKIPSKQIQEYRPMDEDVFWDIISSLNWKKTGDDDAVLRPALKRLSSMKIEDIYMFSDILSEKLYSLDGIDYASNIGEFAYKDETHHFSNDFFLYVRCCVVANGKEYYEDVLANPTEMPKDLDFEALLYLPGEAYKKLTNSDDYDYNPKYDYETYSNSEKWSN